MTPKSFVIDHRNFVRKFFKQFPEHKQYWDKTSIKPFTEVMKQFHKDLIDAVITNREGADMPLMMGNLSIMAYKPSTNYVNFTKYSKFKEVSNFTNNHTDGLVCRIVYANYLRRCRFKDKKIWAFHPEMPFKKAVSKAFIADYNKYIYSPDRSKYYYQVLDNKLRDDRDAKIEKFLQEFDEFYINE